LFTLFLITVLINIKAIESVHLLLSLSLSLSLFFSLSLCFSRSLFVSLFLYFSLSLLSLVLSLSLSLSRSASRFNSLYIYLPIRSPNLHIFFMVKQHSFTVCILQFNFHVDNCTIGWNSEEFLCNLFSHRVKL